VLVVSGLVYVPMPPAVYAVCKDAALAASINAGLVVELKVVPVLSNLTLVRLVQF